MSTPTDLLCRGFPDDSEVGIFSSYTCALRFDDKPDYSYLRKLFRDPPVREGSQCVYVFDWSVQRSAQDEQQSTAASSKAATRRRKVVQEEEEHCGSRTSSRQTLRTSRAVVCMHWLSRAYEDVQGEDNGLELIDLLTIFDPLREDHEADDRRRARA